MGLHRAHGHLLGRAVAIKDMQAVAPGWRSRPRRRSAPPHTPVMLAYLDPGSGGIGPLDVFIGVLIGLIVVGFFVMVIAAVVGAVILVGGGSNGSLEGDDLQSAGQGGGERLHDPGTGAPGAYRDWAHRFRPSPLRLISLAPPTLATQRDSLTRSPWRHDQARRAKVTISFFIRIVNLRMPVLLGRRPSGAAGRCGRCSCARERVSASPSLASSWFPPAFAGAGAAPRERTASGARPGACSLASLEGARRLSWLLGEAAADASYSASPGESVSRPVCRRAG